MVVVKMYVHTFFVLCLVEYSLALKLPDYFNPCHRNDPNLGECISARAHEVVPKLMLGDKSLKIPRLSPFHISEVIIEAPGNFVLKFTNLTIKGLEGVDVLDVKPDLENMVFSAKYYFPYINLFGNYEIDGRILILPIKGNGFANSTFEDLRVEVHCNLGVTKKDGDDYMTLEHMDLTFDVKHASYFFDNLFNGDKVLGEQTNKFLNENWEALIQDIGPVIKSTIEQIVRNIIHNVMELVPLKEIFID